MQRYYFYLAYKLWLTIFLLKIKSPDFGGEIVRTDGKTFRAAQIFLSGWKDILLCSCGHTFGSNPKGFELLRTYLAMFEWTYTEMVV